jgi:hypothetical protein
MDFVALVISNCFQPSFGVHQKLGEVVKYNFINGFLKWKLGKALTEPITCI